MKWWGRWRVLVVLSVLGMAAAWSSLLVRPTLPQSTSASRETTSAPSAPTSTVATPTTRPPVPTTAPTRRIAVPAGAPVSISIPSVHIDESVRAQAPNDGVLEPPPDQVIWDSQTPKPGQAGGALIVGHDEWDGPSDFWNLDDIRMGAMITVGYPGGVGLTFVVTGTKSELKTEAQDDTSIWRPSRSRDELIVVTCDKYSPVVAGHHLNNFIVYATER
jgi:sortase (surface protein transpeptidase)